MGRGDCLFSSRGLSRSAPTALLARTRDQSRLDRLSRVVSRRLFAGELVFSTQLARNLPERFWNFASDDIKPATLDHADVPGQFRRRLELGVRGLRATTRL